MTLAEICYASDSPSPPERRPRILHGASGVGGWGVSGLRKVCH